MSNALNIIPTFAYETDRFWLSGYGDGKITLEKTIIAKSNGKKYLAYTSLIEFTNLITSVTHEEKVAIEDAVKDFKGVSCSNCKLMIDVDQVMALRNANVALINKYLDHIESL